MRNDKSKRPVRLICTACRSSIIMYVSYKEAWCTRCSRKGRRADLKEVEVRDVRL